MAEPRQTRSAWIRLDARIGWRLLEGAPIEGVLAGDTLALGVAGRRPIADTDPLGSFGGRKLLRGLALSDDGRLYVADAEGRRLLTCTSADADRASEPGVAAPLRTFWPARPLPVPHPHDPDPGPNTDDPYLLVRPTDIALTARDDLVIADAGARRVLIVAPDGATLRAVRRLPGELAGTGAGPWALAIDARGAILVADHDGGRIWRLLSSGAIDSRYRGKADDAFRPSNIAAGPDGGVFAVSRGRVLAFDQSGRPVDRPLPAVLSPPPLVWQGDTLTAPRSPREPLCLPGFRVDRDGFVPVTDDDPPRALPLLARPRRVARPRSGRVVFGPFDGGTERLAWDRVALAAEIPPRTRMVAETLTADTPLEPTLVLDGDWSRPLALDPGSVPEILVQSSGGRYLWVRLEFFGDGTATPEIAGIEILAPRDSGLAFLPPPFHQDPVSADFVDRFLSYFEVQREELQAVARGFPVHVDPRAVPEGFLDWLGAWFGWEFLAEWPEATRRDMIARSVEFFRKRGTVAGLRMMLQWHTGLADPMPAILEHFRLRDLPADNGVWLAGARQTDTSAHAFTVVLPATVAPDSAARARIEALIEAQKPAHTRPVLCLIGAGLRVRDQALLGVDTLLGSTQGEPLGSGRLGQTMQTARGAGPVMGATARAVDC